MRKFAVAVTLLFVVHLLTSASGATTIRENGQPGTRNDNEEEAKEFLLGYNAQSAVLTNNYVLADWAYNTNLTDENAEASIAAGLKLSAFGAEAFANASLFDPTNFSFDVVRQLSKVGSKGLSEDEMKNLSSIISQMGSIYGQAKVCRGEGTPEEECLALEPELTILLAESKNASERLWAWEGWRRVVGREIRPLYIQYVELKNKLARENGYDDYGDQLRQKYETKTFESDVQKLYDEMKPLYMELHAYIRRKLFETYGQDVVDIKGALPQHLLGDMWGRFWTNLYRYAVPYPDRPELDVTQALIDQQYNITRLFQTGENFYTSMGLKPLPTTFHDLSMLDKPTDREVLCHATAWDFYDAKDFRIKMCTKINFEDFLTIHHELGHIQYFMQYADQPTVYRDGANDGFHEAVGELMSMCVSTPKHLYTIGLLDELLDDRETEINYLLSMALTTVSTLPFHYLQDLWRWRAFRGDFPLEEWNDEFWKLSEDIVGVKSPVGREEGDLDPPTIFHVATDYDMSRYFTRTILQFQFAESLCEAAGHEGPLNECDFYGSTPAGDKLAAMLKLGSSKPWPDALEALTGERTMNARAIRSYFQPLEDWLKLTNWLNNDTPGWTTGTGTTAPASSTASSHMNSKRSSNVFQFSDQRKSLYFVFGSIYIDSILSTTIILITAYPPW